MDIRSARCYLVLELAVVLFSLLDLLSVDELADLLSVAVVLLSFFPFSLFPFSLFPFSPLEPLCSCEPLEPFALSDTLLPL